MKNTPDYKSRFRILKGGKISLVVSALLVGSTMMTTTAHATEPTYYGISDNGTFASPADYVYDNESGKTLTGYTYTQFGSPKQVGIYGLSGQETSTFTIENNQTINISSSAYGAAGIFAETTGKVYQTNAITNNGDINIQGESAYIYGITVERADTGMIINNADINLVTTPESYSVIAGIIVHTGSLNNGSQLINNGTMTLRGDVASIYGIKVGNISNTEKAGIVNGEAGVIQIDGGSGSTGISLGGDTGTKVENAGEIYVNTHSMKGSVIGIFSDGSDVNNSGTIEATIGGSFNETTQKIENGVLDALTISMMTLSGSTVTNSETGQLNGNLYVAGTLNNAGTIRLPYNANNLTNVKAPARVGTFVNAGTLEIGVKTDGTMKNTSYSQLMATNATFSAGSKINVNVLSTSTSEELLIGQVLKDVVFVEGGEGSSLTVSEGLTITDNSSKLNFERVINDDTSIDLRVLKGQSYQERSALGGANAATQSAAAAAEEKGIDFVGVVDGDDAGFAKAVTSTTPVTTMAANTANTQIMNGLQGIVEMRQNNVMSGMNSGDMTMVEKNLWAKVYGSMGQQDDKNGMNGFDVNSYGIGIGADAEVAAKQRIGAALFYTRAQVDVNNMNQNTDLDVYTAMVYGNVKIAQNTDFLYQAGYTWQKTASERVDFFTDRYTADFTSKVASLDLKLMQTYKMDNALTLRPLVGTTYRHFTNPSYNENGTGTTGALSTEKFTSTQMIASAGAIAEYKTTKDSQIIANLHVGYDFHHDEQAVTSSYAGGYSFTTDGIDNGGWQYDIGMGYETANILGGEINFMYNYQGQGSTFDNHVLSAKYVYKF